MYIIIYTHEIAPTLCVFSHSITSPICYIYPYIPMSPIITNDLYNVSFS